MSLLLHTLREYNNKANSLLSDGKVQDAINVLCDAYAEYEQQHGHDTLDVETALCKEMSRTDHLSDIAQMMLA